MKNDLKVKRDDGSIICDLTIIIVVREEDVVTKALDNQQTNAEDLYAHWMS